MKTFGKKSYVHQRSDGRIEAVIWCRTQREARDVVRLHAMTQQQLEDLMLTETERQEKASDDGWEPGRIDLARGFLAAIKLGKT